MATSDSDWEYGKRISRSRRKKKKELLLATSPLKIDVMSCLMNEDELNTRKLSIRLDVHQSSISHILRDLIEGDLVTKTKHGYRLTSLGRLKVHLLDFQKMAFESIEKNRDFILAHDMNDIPMHYLIDIGIICNQREYLIGDASTPYRNLEYLVGHLNNCREIRCIPSVVTSDNVESIANAIKNKADVEMIISDTVLQTLRRHYHHILKEMVGCDNLKIYRIKEANFSLWVTESNLFLGLRRFDGCYDLENVIICKTENGLEWGNMLFDHYRRKAGASNNSSFQFLVYTPRN